MSTVTVRPEPETPVLFLDGDNRGLMIFGIPAVPEWRRVLSMDDTLAFRWCGESECCEPPTEPATETYYIVALGRLVRVATMNSDLARDRDRLAFKLAETAAYFENCSPMAEIRRRHEENKRKMAA